MVPDKFNMVDMGGIDLIMVQGEEVPGLYNRLVESIAQCHYQCLYNWFFDGIVIPPTYVIMEVNEDDEVVINEGVVVTDDDVVHIYSIERPPEIIPLLAEENGVYNAPSGKDGFNPVTVDVPSYTPVINPISITENGTYNPPSGVDGYAPVTVDVSGSSLPSRTASEAGGIIHAECLTDGSNIYIKWWFEGVSFSSTGHTITDSVLSQWVPEGKALNTKFCTKAYSNDKTTYIGDLCFEFGVLKMLSTSHAVWMAADNVYAVMYTSAPFDLSDLTTTGGSEGIVQQNTYVDP